MREDSDNQIKEYIAELHRNAPLIDLHADTLSSIQSPEKFLKRNGKMHLDLPRMIESNICCAVFSLFVYPDKLQPEKWSFRLFEKLETIERTVELSDGAMRIALSAKDILENRNKGIVSAMIEIEGLHSIDSDLANIEKIYKRGVRIFTLTWNNTNRYATSCMDDRASSVGLTAEGLEALSEIEKLGGIIDLSHSGEKTFWEIIEKAKNPPICSHSCCRALKESTRNLNDDQIVAMIERGGIIAINFYPGFLSTKSHSQITVEDIILHIEHIANMGGINNIGLGSDFDGVRCLPKGLEDCTGIKNLTAGLISRGFDDYSILKILGANFISYLENSSKPF